MKKFELDEEVLTDLFDICKALVSCNMINTITKGETNTIFTLYQSEIERAQLFIESYERYTKGQNDNDSNN